ncbi:2-C-methyl-D-erythritol 4-phosphate cytidylyltransferase [Kocuria sp. M4R2S49]|uniref:2-C-methyl-D-erythritol 4-phosphate cytidylyltransferase n=1 Tax=Kocuria rhizosphaericola TaxID=3376284 RepID=UPI00379FF743
MVQYRRRAQHNGGLALSGTVAVIPCSSAFDHVRPGALPFTSAALRRHTVFEHVLGTLAGCSSIDAVVVLADEATLPYFDESLAAPLRSEIVVRRVPVAPPGTAARSLLTHCAELASTVGHSNVLIHRMSHALASAELLDSVADALGAGDEVVVPGIPVVDSIMAVDEEDVGVISGGVDRQGVKVLQSPWGFSAGTLVHVHGLPSTAGPSARSACGAPGREFSEWAHRLADRADRVVTVLPGEMQAVALRSTVDVLRAEVFYEAGTAVRAL